MKVCDILEAAVDDQSDKRVPEFATRVATMKSNDPAHRFVGSGTNAYVHSRDDPHDMDRVYRTAKRADGGSIYLRYIATHPNLHNNPYFPRVVQAPSNHREAFPTYQIEPLKDFYWKPIANNPVLCDAVYERIYGPRDEADDDAFTMLDRHLAEDMDNCIYSGIITKRFKDTSLVEALTIIHQLARRYRLSGDVHTGNIMWRLTSTMPQLVITDPLWDNTRGGRS